MRSNNNNPLTRDEILSRYFPQYRPAVATSQGLSGGSCIIAHDTHRVVLRRHHDPDAPPAHFLRHYRALSQLPASLAPRALFYTPGWMAVEYLHGVVNSALPDADELAALLYHLHQQPRLAGVSRYRHYWRSTGRVAIRQGVRRFGCGGSNSCKKTVNLARCGSRLCIWMSMATI